MKADKKVIDHLAKCYALTEFDYDGERHLVVAAEKGDPCYVYNLEGKRTDTLWEGPGGVMTICQYPFAPDNDPILLATRKFFSPNDSSSASISYYTREKDGKWACHILCDIPFVHRFGLLERNGEHYLIACTLKSAHAFKDDWTCPGRIWVSELPKDIRSYNEDNQLVLTPLVSGLYKNHGFCKCTENGYSFALVGTDNGVYKVVPPMKKGGEWTYECLLDHPASDMLYQDYDGDGEKELLVISPFHGENLSIYKQEKGAFRCVYECEKKMPFLHAIWGSEINGKQYAFLGNRREDNELFVLYHNGKEYTVDVLDRGAGPTNVMYYKDGEKDMLFAANRETDEVALYELHI